MSGLFEHLAATDDSEMIAHRKASAVALKRIRDQFGEFLANAGGSADRVARVRLIEDDADDIVRQVVAEYGGDAEKIIASIRHSMMPGQVGPGGNPTPGVPGGAAAVGAPIGPAGGSTCPHCGGVGCPMCQGQNPMAPSTMNGVTPQMPSTGQPMTAARQAAGAFCDKCRGWKSGPGKKCTCEGNDLDSTVTPGDSDEVDTHEPDEAREARVRMSLTPSAEHFLSIDTQPIMHAQPLPDEPGKEGVLDIDGELAKAPSAVGRGESTTANVKEAEALKTVDLPTGGESALGGPSPKIDKGNSGDNFGWSLDPIDTQMDGSPHPTIQQDPTDKADYNKKDFLDQTNAVNESVELDSAPDLMDDAGFAPGGEEHGPHTDTWSDKGTQQDPVTNVALSSRPTDPDKNPLRELVEDYENFLMPNQVEAAIKSWVG